MTAPPTEPLSFQKSHAVTQAAASAARDAAALFRADVWAGLEQDQKAIPSKYFYDERGSRLFEAICRLPEYYPTRTEMRLLKEHAGELAHFIGHAPLIEFGSGSSDKVRILLDAAPRIVNYVPVDISTVHLSKAAAQIAHDYPRLRVFPIFADFTQPFRVPQQVQAESRVGFFPGSTIGNFSYMESLDFLAHAARILGPGGSLLVGVDLKKDPAVLRAAYNDSAGVTAAFNLNLLRRINFELGGTFDMDAFRHDAVYNSLAGRIEMYLVSDRPQTVSVAGRTFSFAQGERLHTENSHKYDIPEFQALATGAGFTPEAVWTDDENLFSLHYLKVG